MLVSLHHILISSLVFIFLLYPTLPVLAFACFEESVLLGVLAVLLFPLTIGIYIYFEAHDWYCYRAKHYCPECKKYIGRAKKSVVIPTEE